ncbi:hypothetical protein AcW1_009444 [Taiwanofungus camphoratus]|nr:hypothetical protein AcW1_009444 [Antrodia cinnamomea]
MSPPLRIPKGPSPQTLLFARCASPCRCINVFIPTRRLTTSTGSWIHSRSRISTVFGTLIALGVGSTVYGLYEFYSTFTMWPKEVRGDLRAGVKAKNQSDLSLSERYLRRAYDTAQSLPLSELSPAPHLKLSGIAISLASVLEDSDKPEPAYGVYEHALTQLQAVPDSELTSQERMRKVALAAKLGAMAEEFQLPLEEEEKWLTCAVEELLRVVKDEGRQAGRGMEKTGQGEETPVMLAELEMPKWVSKTDMGAPLEALGQFYSREGKAEYAIPLYLQAISLLVPPTSSKAQSTTEERCHGAQLMNNLAELVLRGPPTPEKRNQAEAWARQALGTIERTKATAKGDSEELQSCEEALTAVLFNLGYLLEMAGDLEQSRDMYKASWDQARRIRMKEGTLEAQAALRRIERAAKRGSNVAVGSVTSQANSQYPS